MNEFCIHAAISQFIYYLCVVILHMRETGNSFLFLVSSQEVQTYISKYIFLQI